MQAAARPGADAVTIGPAAGRGRVRAAGRFRGFRAVRLVPGAVRSAARAAPVASSRVPRDRQALAASARGAAYPLLGAPRRRRTVAARVPHGACPRVASHTGRRAAAPARSPSLRVKPWPCARGPTDDALPYSPAPHCTTHSATQTLHCCVPLLNPHARRVGPTSRRRPRRRRRASTKGTCCGRADRGPSSECPRIGP
jgi:hypothetical protein